MRGRNTWRRCSVHRAKRPLRFSPSSSAAFPSVTGYSVGRRADSWSARDAYGTAVQLDLEQTTVFREHQPESGFVGQHSSTMVIGIGQRDAAKRMEIRWLSGKLQRFDDVPRFSGAQMRRYALMISASPASHSTPSSRSARSRFNFPPPTPIPLPIIDGPPTGRQPDSGPYGCVLSR